MRRCFIATAIVVLMLVLIAPVVVSASGFPQIKILIKQAKFKQALKLIEPQCFDKHKQGSVSTADCFSLQGQILLELSDFRKPEPLFKQALLLREGLLGKDHIDVASSLNDLGELYRHRGEYEKPEALYQRALLIRLKRLGESHPKTAEIYKNLGELFHDQGKYKKADKLYRKAVEVLKAIEAKDEKDENKLALAEIFNWQGLLYQEQNRLAEAEIYYQQSIDYRYRILGEKHPHFLDSLMGLTALYLAKGDYDLSLSLALEIENILESIGYQQHIDYARISWILADIYNNYNLSKKVEYYYQRALDIHLKVYGEDNIMTAYSYSDLGWINADKGKYKAAKGYFQKALNIRVKVLSSRHQEVAYSKSALAWIASKQGNLKQAEMLLRDALDIFDATLGSESIAKVNVFYDLSVLKWRQGELNNAIKLMSEAEAIQEQEIKRYLTTGSERQKIAYMKTLRRETDYALSLHLQADIENNDAAKLALNTILRRKGRVIDVVTENSIRKLLPTFPVEVQKQVITWQNTKQQLAVMTLKKPASLNKSEYLEKLTDLRYKVDVMSSIIESLKNLLVKDTSETVDFEKISRLIPSDSLLLEFAIYTPFKTTKSSGNQEWGKKRLAAYTLDTSGNIQAIDLGDVGIIKNRFNIARKKLSTPLSSIASVNRSLHRLDDLIFKPIISLLGETKNILIAPDGFINLLPFSALVDGNGKYRGDHFRFSYLTSGRDLLSMRSSKKDKPTSNPALIIANPNFDSIKVNSKKEKTPKLAVLRSGDFNEIQFKPLPYTEYEAIELKKIIPNARILLAEQASEEKLKSVQSPYILHIATHGFFNAKASSGWSVQNNPLLNSGLALSGVNQQHDNDAEDGILTALEITELNLSDTELVVLSACETGVGVVENGQGLYGLRRALVLAGSKSQLLSLWKVSDKVTKEVMSLYYHNLFSKFNTRQGRAEAIQNTRIAIREKYPHPFYWSSFIPSGDWKVLH